MKVTKLTAIFFTFTIGSLSQLSLANVSSNGQKVAESPKIKKVHYKCYVQTLGGHESIQFATVYPQEKFRLKTTLIGLSNLPITAKDPVKIIKVGECVKESEKFSDSHIRELDENTPR